MVRKYQNKKQKLTQEDYDRIVELWEEGKLSFYAIGREYNISGTHVAKVVRKHNAEEK